MKFSVESRYIAVFGFSLVVTLVSLIASINKLQPFLFQQLFTSCTAIYQNISTNWLIISIVFVAGLIGLLVSLSLKLILSSYKTSQRLASISTNLKTKFPKQLINICKKLNVSTENFIVTSHTKPVAFTAGLFSPKIIFSRGLIEHLSYKELESVVLHELYHQQHKHGLLYVMAEAVASALSLLVPVLKEVVTNMKLDFESAADLGAVAYQGDAKHIARALAKLSGQTVTTHFPSFATVLDTRLELLQRAIVNKRSLSKGKLIVSVVMIMLLSFFASMPLDSSRSVVYADQHETANVCVSTFSVGMSKWQNSSSILPASVF